MLISVVGVSLTDVVFTKYFSVETLLGFVIAILGIIATSILLERYGAIEELRTKFYNGNSVEIRTRDEIEKEYPVERMIHGASKVYVMALVASQLVIGYKQGFLKEAMNNETKFTFIVTEPDSEANKEQLANKLLHKSTNSTDVRDTVLNLWNESPVYKRNLSFLTTEVNLPYCIFVVFRKKGRKHIVDHMRVDLYAVDVDNISRPSFIVPNENEVLQTFFLKQWKTVEKKSAIL